MWYFLAAAATALASGIFVLAEIYRDLRDELDGVQQDLDIIVNRLRDLAIAVSALRATLDKYGETLDDIAPRLS